MDEARQLLADRAERLRQHLRDYIETDGARGYLWDMTRSGGSAMATHLVLRTVGRRSRQERFTPLTYAAWGDEYVIVASKGGFEQHPAWFLNLISRPEVEFQVKEKRYRGSWRIAEGDERATLWEYAATYFPGYREYQKRTTRTIPVLVLSPGERIEERWTLPDEVMPNLGTE